ncbi:MAG: hypothetical protein HQL29_04180 [Candidatus Omnitrophica bacterium]|nr:hypothetical protein [Candidatus Omnitrophota bacterium]
MESKSVRNLNEKMEEIEAGSIRYKVLESAKKFKTSWIDLGQTLYTVWKDKLYQEWGYKEFDNYTRKEIGIKSQTSLKLLRSYGYLEQESPEHLKHEVINERDTKTIPTYESVDVLRRASGKKDLGTADVSTIKRKVLEEGRDAKDAAKDLTVLMKKRRPEQTEEQRIDEKLKRLAKLVNLVKLVKNEILVNENVITEALSAKTELVLNEVEDKISKALERGKKGE